MEMEPVEAQFYSQMVDVDLPTALAGYGLLACLNKTTTQQITRGSNLKPGNHCSDMRTLSVRTHVLVSPHAKQKARKDLVVTLDPC